MKRPFVRGTTRSLGDLLTMVINHLLNGMILQAGSTSRQLHNFFGPSTDMLRNGCSARGLSTAGPNRLGGEHFFWVGPKSRWLKVWICGLGAYIFHCFLCFPPPPSSFYCVLLAVNSCLSFCQVATSLGST